MQHALLRTWDEWQGAGGVGPVDLRHYELAGGLERALDQDAEGALKGLDIGITARIFQRLTDTDLSQRRVRSPARISELMAAAGADRGTVEGIVRRFEEGGRSLVHPSADGRPDDPRVDISHESLIRQWVRLRNWVDEERRSRDQYKELVARARKKARALLRDPELQMVIDWKATVTLSSGWAQRYSNADGDFECAARYLDESVEERCRNRAEAELRRRWTKFWSPIIVVIEAGVGLRIEKIASLTADSSRLIGDAKSAKSPGALLDLAKTFVSRDFFEILLFLAVCVGLNLCAKWAYRRFAYVRILESIVSSSKLGPIEVKARAAERRDAVVVHDTTYAPAYRRVAGFVIDGIVFVVFAIVAMGILTTANRDPGNSVSNATTSTWMLVCLAFSCLYSTLQITWKRQATLACAPLAFSGPTCMGNA